MGPKTEGIGLCVLQSTPKAHAHTNTHTQTKEACITTSALSCMHYDAIAAPLRTPFIHMRARTHTHPHSERPDSDCCLCLLLTHISSDLLYFIFIILYFISLQFLPLTSLRSLQSNKVTQKMWGMPTPHIFYRHQGRLADTGRQTLNFNLGVTCFFLAPQASHPYWLPP